MIYRGTTLWSINVLFKALCVPQSALPFLNPSTLKVN